jgi:hypothetical protein
MVVVLRLALLGSLLLWAAGCQQQRFGGADPKDVHKITERAGATAIVADASGTVYILDSSDKQVFTTPMRYAEKLLFFPERQQIVLNGQVVHQGGLDHTKTYQFYFVKGNELGEPSAPGPATQPDR